VTESRTRVRLKVLAALVVAMFAVLTTRLWFLQVLASPQFDAQAKDNQVRIVPITPLRGEILDRNGDVLVGRRSSVVVTIDRQELPTDQTDAVLFRLSNLLHVPVPQLVSRLNSVQYLPYQPVPVALDVSQQDVFYIREHQSDFPGVGYQLAAVPSYPQGDLAAQILGSIGRMTDAQSKEAALKNWPLTSEVGQTGLEAVYDSELRGELGKREMQVNAAGDVLNPNFGRIPSTAGDNLVTSIDANVQRLAERSLAQGISVAHSTFDQESQKYLQASGGAVVVMDPRTGHVIALASNPTFDPSIWVKGLTNRQYRQLTGTGSNPGPLFDRATQGAYPPGSTFKPFVGGAALRAHVINENSSLDCPGKWEVPGDTSHTVFNNWNPVNVGFIGLASALVQSCDTFFYQLGYKFWQDYVHSGYNVDTGLGGTETMQHELDQMGFGRRTRIDLPAEAPGRLPTAAYKRALVKSDPRVYGKYYQWLPGDNINMSIGQGFVTVTPIQLAVAYSAIANGGKLFAPRIGWKVQTPDGKLVRVIHAPIVGHLPLSRQQINFLRNALTGVVRPGGTAAPAFAGFPLGSIPVAGKTGTADIVGRQPYSWFAAMAPANNPRYVVVALVEQGGHGGTTAAPIVRNVLQGLFGLNTGGVQAGSDSST
jgi:penicillin-binding protein 2